MEKIFSTVGTALRQDHGIIIVYWGNSSQITNQSKTLLAAMIAPLEILDIIARLLDQRKNFVRMDITLIKVSVLIAAMVIMDKTVNK